MEALHQSVRGSALAANIRAVRVTDTATSKVVVTLDGDVAPWSSPAATSDGGGFSVLVYPGGLDVRVSRASNSLDLNITARLAGGLLLTLASPAVSSGVALNGCDRGNTAVVVSPTASSATVTRPNAGGDVTVTVPQAFACQAFPLEEPFLSACCYDAAMAESYSAALTALGAAASHDAGLQRARAQVQALAGPSAAVVGGAVGGAVGGLALLAAVAGVGLAWRKKRSRSGNPAAAAAPHRQARDAHPGVLVVAPAWESDTKL